MARAEFKWNPGAKEKWDKRFSEAQKFLDSEVLRTTTPYVPHRTGTLINSGIMGTVPGTGEVVWNEPYAARQYYGTSESRPYDSQRGSRWFERSKIDHKDEWLRGAKKIAGGG